MKLLSIKPSTLCGAIAVSAILMLSSCKSPEKIAYFQDTQYETPVQIKNSSEIKAAPDDKLSIVVSSKDPQLAQLFNLPMYSVHAASGKANSTQYVSTYTINKDGNIDFPIVGELHIEGLTRSQIAALIKSRLLKENLIADPTVTVEFTNLYVSVMGEVARPGRYEIDRDRMSVLEAISKAGDLTITGQRDKVSVIRTVDGVQTIYPIDLTSTQNLTQSPAYYIQQNDVIYVEPNEMKARQSTLNGNNVLSTSFWISIASLATNVAVLIMSAVK